MPGAASLIERSVTLAKGELGRNFRQESLGFIEHGDELAVRVPVLSAMPLPQAVCVAGRQRALHGVVVLADEAERGLELFGGEHDCLLRMVRLTG